jgi:hypothetical protein
MTTTEAKGGQELQEAWAEVERQEEGRGVTARRIGQVAEKQAELRRTLVDAPTSKARKAGLEALTPILTEVACLPDEAVIRADRYARALHNWAQLAVDRIGEIEAAGRREINQVYETAGTDEETIEQTEDAPTRTREQRRGVREAKTQGKLDRTAISIRVSHETRRIERRVQEEVLPLKRLVAGRLREVFNTLSVGYVENGAIGSIDRATGRLCGHEHFLEKVRDHAEVQLRAEAQL